MDHMSTVLVTGASVGLGLASARELAGAGHDVVLHVRRRERVEDPAVLDAVAEVVEADLSDLDATVDLAERVNALGHLDAVIHNAGVMTGPEVVPVNVVAPYVLSALLDAPGRSVFLSSGMHLSGRPDVTATSYSDSKLQVTALALALADRGHVSHAVDPGWVATRMGGPGAPDDLDEGHRTQVWLATVPLDDLDPRTGGYWFHHATRDPHRSARDPRFQEAVLDALRRRTGIELS
jgi:NAD(P)-dependent dehydrogenase (short-subunit alcohol dehydrogenase family)